MPNPVLGFVIPNAGCAVDEFMFVLAEPPPEEADCPKVNVLGEDELEPKGLLKEEVDEAADKLENTLVVTTVAETAEELGDENANPVLGLELNGVENVDPAPNCELPNPDPAVEDVAPKETVPGPDEEAPAPNEKVPDPDEAAPTPKDTVPGPVEAVPAPNETVPGPDEAAPTPKETASGPDEVAPAPKDTVPGPDEVAPAPKETVPGPDEAAPVPNPKETVPDPDKEVPAPKEKIPGPDDAAAPNATVPGADEEVPTPKDMVPEPAEEAPAPKDTVPDPDEEAPTPEVGDDKPNCATELWGGFDTVASGCGGLLPNTGLDAVVVVEPAATLEAATGEDEKVEMLEKIDADEVGELEKVEGEVRRLDDGLLIESGAVDLASAVVPPIPNVVVAGFASAISDLTDSAIEEPTKVLEPKLNAVDGGVDEERAGLLLATANMEVDGAELRAGLPAGVSFGDDEYEKPLLRLDDDDAVEEKWSGAFSVVDAADGNTLSDD
ncbi:hypothetical protein PR202_gb10703 [Eleusine coracana subsp. coracana]|uniref:Uncharacterized protein n=1 Tax=Eleusine coracana subsp. coracana TaxID=191504 RepID=A0AAV5ELL5_ELECO|nr:hypothetical protein PR202_gb10703 [Eleusine coracana subsp. coracana]